MSTNHIRMFFAILLEVTGTILLPASQNFIKAVFTVGLGICYMSSFHLLTFAKGTIPVPIVYATCSGLDIFTITIASIVIFWQILSLLVIFGLFLIVIGAVLVNLYGSAHS